jgi:hypothetical protein
MIIVDHSEFFILSAQFELIKIKLSIFFLNHV